jgi:hypothetical protein
MMKTLTGQQRSSLALLFSMWQGKKMKRKNVQFRIDNGQQIMF